MRSWNLSSLEDLEPSVLTAQPASTSVRGRAARPVLRRSSSVRVVMSVAALAAISYSVAVTGTSTTISIRQSDVQLLSNVDADRPPLDVIFGGRFTSDWTRTREDELLNEAVRRSAGPRDQDLLNLIHATQQESLSDDVPRLSDDDVAKLIRRKA